MSGPLSDGEMAALADVTCGRRLHDGTECEKPVGHRGWCLDAELAANRARSAAQLRADARARRRAWWVHNLIAHPLLVLCPPVGEWLHDRTAPEEA